MSWLDKPTYRDAEGSQGPIEDPIEWYEGSLEAIPRALGEAGLTLGEASAMATAGVLETLGDEDADAYWKKYEQRRDWRKSLGENRRGLVADVVGGVAKYATLLMANRTAGVASIFASEAGEEVSKGRSLADAETLAAIRAGTLYAGALAPASLAPRFGLGATLSYGSAANVGLGVTSRALESQVIGDEAGPIFDPTSMAIDAILGSVFGAREYRFNKRLVDAALDARATTKAQDSAPGMPTNGEQLDMHMQAVADATKATETGLDPDFSRLDIGEVDPRMAARMNDTIKAIDEAMPSEARVRASDLDSPIENMSRDEIIASFERLRGHIKENPLTTLPSKAVWEARAEDGALGEYVASIDADSLKWINDNLGHEEGGNALLKSIGQALKKAGVDAYHISGDEFYATANSKEALDAGLKKAQDLLKEAEISGGGWKVKGAGISYGIAKNITDAESNLHIDKSAREAAGLRAGRGQQVMGAERTAGINDGRTAPGRVKDDSRNVPLKEQAKSQRDIFVEKRQASAVEALARLHKKGLYLDDESYGRYDGTEDVNDNSTPVAFRAGAAIEEIKNEGWSIISGDTAGYGDADSSHYIKAKIKVEEDAEYGDEYIDAKIRIANHGNTSSLHDRADINIAPNNDIVDDIGDLLRGKIEEEGYNYDKVKKINQKTSSQSEPTKAELLRPIEEMTNAVHEKATIVTQDGAAISGTEYTKQLEAETKQIDDIIGKIQSVTECLLRNANV